MLSDQLHLSALKPSLQYSWWCAFGKIEVALYFTHFLEEYDEGMITGQKE